jgi:hypothetical protein
VVSRRLCLSRNLFALFACDVGQPSTIMPDLVTLSVNNNTLVIEIGISRSCDPSLKQEKPGKVCKPTSLWPTSRKPYVLRMSLTH